MEEVEKNDYLKDNWGEWLEKDIKDGLSVTEIEMQYGVLRRKQNKKKEEYHFMCLCDKDWEVVTQWTDGVLTELKKKKNQ